MTIAAEPHLHYFTHDDFVAATLVVVEAVVRDGRLADFVVGIGRGGLVPAVYIAHALGLPMLSIDLSSKVPGFAEELLGKVARKSAEGIKLLIIDDINDSGQTITDIRALLAQSGSDSGQVRFAVLVDNLRSKARVDYYGDVIDRQEDKRWFVFPWEAVGTRQDIVAEARSVPERLA